MRFPAEDRPLARAPRERQGIAYSTCYLCACCCGIEITLENGRIRFIPIDPERATALERLVALARRTLAG